MVGRETAPTTGTLHLQGFVYFKNPRSETAVRKLLTGCHVEPQRGTNAQAAIYAKKEGDFEEWGEAPIDEVSKGDLEIQRWDTALANARLGRFDLIPSDILVRYYSAINRIFQDSMLPPPSIVTGKPHQ